MKLEGIKFYDFTSQMTVW